MKLIQIIIIIILLYFILRNEKPIPLNKISFLSREEIQPLPEPDIGLSTKGSYNIPYVRIRTELHDMLGI